MHNRYGKIDCPYPDFFRPAGAIPRGNAVHEPKAYDSAWSKDFPPFRIAGNLYYVGTYDLACYLITTPEGLILINTGLAASGPLIEKHIKQLGLEPTNLKILLLSQAHFDHAGAMGYLKQLTGAKLMADAGDVPVLEDGGKSDFIMGGKDVLFQPVKVDRVLHDHDVIKLGDMQLTMLHHPGHTKGSCSFLFNVKDSANSYRVLIANMPTVLDPAKPNMPAYPKIVADYQTTFVSLESLQFDIWLAAHASQFDLHKKYASGDPYQPSRFRDNESFKKELAEFKAAFQQKLQAR